MFKCEVLTISQGNNMYITLCLILAALVIYLFKDKLFHMCDKVKEMINKVLKFFHFKK